MYDEVMQCGQCIHFSSESASGAGYCDVLSSAWCYDDSEPCGKYERRKQDGQDGESKERAKREQRASKCGAVVVMAVCSLMLTSCRTIRETVEVPVYLRDTVQAVQVQIDSIEVERVREVYTRGDTVFVTQTEERVIKEVRIDTVREFFEKPVKVVEKEVVEVEKKNGFIHKILFYSGLIALLAVIVSVSRQFSRKI